MQHPFFFETPDTVLTLCSVYACVYDASVYAFPLLIIPLLVAFTFCSAFGFFGGIFGHVSTKLKHL